MNTLPADRDTAAAREATATTNLRVAEVALVTLSCDVIMAQRRANRMEVALINWRTKVDDCLDVSNFCRSMNRSAGDSLVGTFISAPYEACRENAMSPRGDNDGSVDSAIAAVHGQLLPLRGSVNARSQGLDFLLYKTLLKQILVLLTHAVPPAFRLSIHDFSKSLFILDISL